MTAVLVCLMFALLFSFLLDCNTGRSVLFYNRAMRLTGFLFFCHPFLLIAARFTGRPALWTIEIDQTRRRYVRLVLAPLFCPQAHASDKDGSVSERTTRIKGNM